MKYTPFLIAKIIVLIACSIILGMSILEILILPILFSSFVIGFSLFEIKKNIEYQFEKQQESAHISKHIFGAFASGLPHLMGLMMAKNTPSSKTTQQLLDEAIAREDYEEAARLRELLD